MNAVFPPYSSSDVAFSRPRCCAGGFAKPRELFPALHRIYVGLRGAISCLVSSPHMLAPPQENESHQTENRGHRHLAKKCTTRRCNDGVRDIIDFFLSFFTPSFLFGMYLKCFSFLYCRKSSSRPLISVFTTDSSSDQHQNAKKNSFGSSTASLVHAQHSGSSAKLIPYEDTGGTATIHVG